MNAAEYVNIPAAAIPDIRRMLVIGLSCLEEIERLESEVRSKEALGLPVDKSLSPLHPTGGDEIERFATALMWLEMAGPAEDKA